jgi:hypothetical protein
MELLTAYRRLARLYTLSEKAGHNLSDQSYNNLRQTRLPGSGKAI